MGFFSNVDVYSPCPCQSGKKYKFCCLARDREERRSVQVQDQRRLPGIDRRIDLRDTSEAALAELTGSLLVQRGDSTAGIEFLERAMRLDPAEPSSYNNLAVAHWTRGSVEKAIGIAERVDRSIDPGNVFTLGCLVQFYWLMGCEEAARAAAERLSESTPRDLYAAEKKCEALARFGWHERVLAAAQVETHGGHSGGHSLALDFFAGTACANLARYDEAKDFLRRARMDVVRGERARRYLERLEQGLALETLDGAWPYLEPGNWVTPGLFELGNTPDEMRRYPGVIDGIVAILNDDPEAGDPALGLLALLATPRAVEVLRQVAFGVFGPDSLRECAFSKLDELGQLPQDQRIWIQGEWKEIRSQKFEVSEDAQSFLPEEIREEMGEMVAALREGEAQRAEALGRNLLARAPECPQVLNNLAAALGLLGRSKEMEPFFWRALEIDLTYCFASAGLAQLLLREGRLDEAGEILGNVLMPAQIHPDAYVALLNAQLDLALKRRNYRGAAVVAESLRGIQDDRQARKKAAQAARLANLLANADEKRLGLERQLRLHLLPADAGLKECLSRHTREELKAIAEALAFPLRLLLGREGILAILTARLQEPGVLLEVLRRLGEDARRALREVYDAGGVMSFAEFTRRHGSEAEDTEQSPWPNARTALGRLKGRGLLAEGAVGGHSSVVIPFEVRAALGMIAALDGLPPRV